MSKGHPRHWSLRGRGFMAILVFVATLCCAAGEALAEGPWLPENVSTVGEKIDGLYRVIFGITTFMLVLTEGALLFFIVRYRRRPGKRASYIHESATAETLWTVIPGLLLLFLAFYQWDAWADAKIRFPNGKDTVRVQILARQFEWHIRYPGPDGIFATDDDVTVTNQMHIPDGRPVMAQLRALDVIHSFFLPHLRVKQDIVPGTTVQVWFDANKTGKYEIACAELCGLGHYRMRGQLFVESADEYESWLQERYKANTASTDWGWDWEEGI